MTVAELQNALKGMDSGAEVYVELEEDVVILDAVDLDDDGDVILSPAEDEDEE